MRGAVVRGLLTVAVTGSLTACGSFAQTATTEPATTTVGPTTATTSPSTSPSPSASSPTVSHGPAGTPTITPGTALPGENLSPDEVAALQAAVDEGHQPWRVDPQMVAEAYLRSWFGWGDVQVEMSDPHTAQATNRPDGRRVTVRVEQPGEQGAHGIWVVTGGTYLG